MCCSVGWDPNQKVRIMWCNQIFNCDKFLSVVIVFHFGHYFAEISTIFQFSVNENTTDWAEDHRSVKEQRPQISQKAFKYFLQKKKVCTFRMLRRNFYYTIYMDKYKFHCACWDCQIIVFVNFNLLKQNKTNIIYKNQNKILEKSYV